MLNAWLESRLIVASSFRATRGNVRVFFSGSSLNFHSTTCIKSAFVNAFAFLNLAPNSRSLCACQPKLLSYLRLHIKKAALSTQFNLQKIIEELLAFLLLPKNIRKQIENKGLVLIYQMGCSVWTIHFLIFAYASVTFTANMQQGATVAISTQHIFFSPPCRGILHG